MFCSKNEKGEFMNTEMCRNIALNNTPVKCNIGLWGIIMTWYFDSCYLYYLP